jgi:hypothetical protein
MQMHAPRACVCNDLHRLLVDQKHPLTIACLVVLEHRRTKTLTHFLPIDTPAKKKKNPTFARKIHHRFQFSSLDGTFTDNPCKDLTFTHESCKNTYSLTLYYSVDSNILERRSFLKVSYEKTVRYEVWTRFHISVVPLVTRAGRDEKRLDDRFISLAFFFIFFCCCMKKL